MDFLFRIIAAVLGSVSLFINCQGVLADYSGLQVGVTTNTHKYTHTFQGCQLNGFRASIRVLSSSAKIYIYYIWIKMKSGSLASINYTWQQLLVRQEKWLRMPSC